MAGALERIEQDVAALKEAIATMAVEFERSYSNYRQALGQAARQQLILACFQICTQAYPESFLKLSFSQREHLQQAIRQVADWGKEQLQAMKSQISTPPWSQESPVVDNEIESLGNIDVFMAESTQDESIVSLPTASESTGVLGSQSGLGVSPSGGTGVSPQVEQVALPLGEELALETPPLNTPEQVVTWQQKMERDIAQTLQALSHQTNRLLQQSGILPERLPSPLLEAANAEGFEAVGGAPNLLNLTIETENSENPDHAHLIHIVAINLRLAEIELADGNCSAWRTQIRQLSHRLNSLTHQYDRKLKEQATAQAESAWRSSWFED